MTPVIFHTSLNGSNLVIWWETLTLNLFIQNEDWSMFFENWITMYWLRVRSTYQDFSTTYIETYRVIFLHCPIHQLSNRLLTRNWWYKKQIYLLVQHLRNILSYVWDIITTLYICIFVQFVYRFRHFKYLLWFHSPFVKIIFFYNYCKWIKWFIVILNNKWINKLVSWGSVCEGFYGVECDALQGFMVLSVTPCTFRLSLPCLSLAFSKIFLLSL